MPPNDNKKSVTIIVNTKEHEITSKEVSYEEVLELVPDLVRQAGANATFNITYRRGQGNKPSGSLVAGGSVKVKEGMVFDVTLTNRS